MSSSADMAAGDPLLAAELAALTPEQRRWLDRDLELRARASVLASELGLDESEVYHQLKHLRRTPIERLRQGLTHGRRRPRVAE